MSDNWIAQVTDVFFNKRRAPGMPEDKPEDKSVVNIHELIRRGISHVKVKDKIYKIVVTEHKV